MAYIDPMFAAPLREGFELPPGVYAAEEKIDGIRIIAEVSVGATSLFSDKQVTPWSRYGLVHPLPSHLLEALAKMPYGIYDGEIYAPGKRSYGATELVNLPDLTYAIFDVLELHGEDQMYKSYEDRRWNLEELARRGFFDDSALQLLPSTDVNTWDEVLALRDAVWARDGEGLILKHKASRYLPKKRKKDIWIKMKKLQIAPVTVIGFRPSKGLLNDRGPFATTVVRDKDGNVTTVKTRNDALCRQAEQLAAQNPTAPHPWIGRTLMIEYQERTPDSNYRHPRWDRWEDE